MKGARLRPPRSRRAPGPRVERPDTAALVPDGGVGSRAAIRPPREVELCDGGLPALRSASHFSACGMSLQEADVAETRPPGSGSRGRGDVPGSAARPRSRRRGERAGSGRANATVRAAGEG